jgi:hypothetical protein
MPLSFIIAGLDPAILFVATKKDARVKPGHDDGWMMEKRDATLRSVGGERQKDAGN